MTIYKYMYEKITGREAPYYYSYSLKTILMKPVRKFVAQVVAPNCPFNNLRVSIYRFCGFRIGRNVFIGMKCYLDDMCYELIEIGDNVVISYGVYFACHGKNQGHFPIVIEDNAYIGMRASIITKTQVLGGVTIGKNAIVGSCALVNRDVPMGCIAVGVPCRIIRK